MVQKKNTKKIEISKKLISIFFIFALVFLVVTIRLFYVMGLKATGYKARAEQQWMNKLNIPAKRGKILDRNGKELAVSLDCYRIDLDLNTLRQTLMSKKTSNEDLALKISPILNMSNEQVLKILNLTSPSGIPASFATLARGINKPQADQIEALKIRGIIVSSDSKRYYPNNNFLSSVLGHIDSEGKGVSGVEVSYDKDLSGIPGNISFQADNRNRRALPYDDSQYISPVDGKDIILTIDENIQLIAEKAAEKALVDNKAKSVTITIMDPKTGEILAMVSKPDYDPNNPNKLTKYNKDPKLISKYWQNNAVQNTFEPGSIFKVITAYAAMETNLVKESDTFVCNGSLKVDGHTINCWRREGHGTESFVDILKNSCNVGFMEVGKKLGKQNLADYEKKFGFGQKTGIDLPGEASGIIKDASKMNNVDLAALSFGQGISVTSVQYLAAFNSIANGGTWIRPHVMKKIIHTDENNKTITDKEYSDFNKKQIVDGNTAATLKGYLEQVVTSGVANNAFIDGYHIAGKTGTAQKALPNGGGYETDKYFSSFAGMAPANDPKITLLVSIDEPNPAKYYGGQVSAPVAKELFENIFNYMIMKGDLSLGQSGK
ncbi:stage V sporulation protein D [Clostridium sp. DJ247]|uniref:stage V sporulation protein D n=1 Tax=Clostridium sp. DJ247 TaxID=2726188 RepID=UPI001627D9F2|nr:stage V sporulation protein D [Clostridium sp. DJ247]MBC2579570.1 stage V sporulation protein D [Clostridium sp. DJ247]